MRNLGQKETWLDEEFLHFIKPEKLRYYLCFWLLSFDFETLMMNGSLEHEKFQCDKCLEELS
jgi:hypothetical protein